ncbi:hypothetical protein KAURM247S_04303 [Kitasatospora aureofaciens]
MTGTRRPPAAPAAPGPAEAQDRARRPLVGVVLLTMNDHPAEERASQATLLAQRGVDVRICVVGNGCTPDVVPAGALTVVLPENLGIPGGRNEGARILTMLDPPPDYLFFMDNDASLPRPDILAQLVAKAEPHPEAGYVQPRLTGPDDTTTPRRWVPRLRTGDPGRPGTITSMTEGVVLIHRTVFDQVGGWCEGRPSATPAGTRQGCECTTLSPARPGTPSSTGCPPATACGWPTATCPPR